MTDEERNAYFERKSKEVKERLCGKPKKTAIAEAKREVIKVDPNESVYSQSRILENMNPTASDPWLDVYNHQRKANGGRIKIYKEIEPEDGSAKPEMN